MLALAFSGGKDSLACWYLYKDKDPLVIWVNTGKNYPEALAFVETIRAQSRFIEVKTDQGAQNAVKGIPSELVPINHTELGFYANGEKPIKVQSYLQCCWDNISMPLHNKCKELGVTHLIRGQRLEEEYKSPARNGTVVDGIEYIQPIETWTKQQVMDFIMSRGPVPEHFKMDHSSLDCFDCTAFLEHSKDRIAWTKEKHPEKYAQFKVRFDALRTAIHSSMAAFAEIENG